MSSLIRIKYADQDDKDSKERLARLRELPENLKPGKLIRKSWVDGIRKVVEGQSGNQQTQPLAFILSLDGSAEFADSSLDDFLEPAECPYQSLVHAQVSEPEKTASSGPVTRTSSLSAYPAPYRIPPQTISQFNNDERVRRERLFALGSMMYEIYSDDGEPPFHDLSETEIQDNFRNAKFPKVTNLPQWPVILACWSTEFAKELQSILGIKPSKFKTFSNAAGAYIKKHPYAFGLQVAGLTVGIAASIALPVLGAAGFGALGPVAGSSAAAWQASMGLVEAGSLFAWCQSAAMGGAAVGGIIAAGAAGGGVLFTASAWALLMEGMGDGEVEEGLRELLLTKFQEVCLKA